MDPSWSETGDRYLIKLFRDYLFHQVTETGEPWLDMSHIVSSLNKVFVTTCGVLKQFACPILSVV
jgi:PAB-dependent poly(A)-specific ribonuclease subunit 3